MRAAQLRHTRTNGGGAAACFTTATHTHTWHTMREAAKLRVAGQRALRCSTYAVLGIFASVSGDAPLHRAAGRAERATTARAQLAAPEKAKRGITVSARCNNVLRPAACLAATASRCRRPPAGTICVSAMRRYPPHTHTKSMAATHRRKVTSTYFLREMPSLGCAGAVSTLSSMSCSASRRDACAAHPLSDDSCHRTRSTVRSQRR